MKTIHILSGAALLIAAPAAFAQMPQPAAETPAAATPTQALPYAAKAGASDLYEIQSSELALKQAKSAEVKTFARMMIKHHTMTTKTLTAAAKSAKLVPPAPMLEPAQADMIAQLQQAQGDAFDQAYVAQQKTAHAMALNLHQTYAAQGDTPQLKKAAAAAVPIVKRHIAQLDRM